MRWATREKGFTIVELIIVVVVIAVLSAIAVVSYNGITAKARDSKIKSDMATLEKAIMLARSNESKLLRGITGVTYTAGTCMNLAAGTDLAALPKTHDCWRAYLESLDKISQAGGMSVRGIVDPRGWPYVIDENEGEAFPDGTVCGADTLNTFIYPYRNPGPHTAASTMRRVPASGLCS